MGVTADKIKEALDRHKRHKTKGKISLPANIELVCISKQDYKDLLRAKTSLNMMNEDFGLSRDGMDYSIPAWKMEVITKVICDTFDETFEQMMERAIIAADGRVKILGSAYDEIMRETNA